MVRARWIAPWPLVGVLFLWMGGSAATEETPTDPSLVSCHEVGAFLALDRESGGDETTPPGPAQAGTPGSITYGVFVHFDHDWHLRESFTLPVLDGELDLGDLDLPARPQAAGGMARLTVRHHGETPPGGRAVDNADPVGVRQVAAMIDSDGSIDVQISSGLSLPSLVAIGIWGAEYLSAASADLADPRGPAMLSISSSFFTRPPWALEIARELCDVPALPGVDETVEKSILVELWTRRIVEASGPDVR